MSGKGEKVGTMVLDLKEICTALGEFCMKKIRLEDGVYDTHVSVDRVDGDVKATVTFTRS